MASADGRWRAQLCREQGDGARRHPAAGGLLTTVKRAHHGVGTQPQQQPTYTAIPPAQKMPDVRLALMVMRQAISNPASPAVHTRRGSPIRCGRLTWCPSCPSVNGERSPIRLRHMPKADPRELKARAGGPKDSVWTQDSFPAVVAVASVEG